MAKIIPIKAVLNERLWVPHTDALEERARDLYQFKHYDEKSCSRCELLPERHCDTCDDCTSFLGEIRLWKTRDIQGKTHIGVPTGNRSKLTRWLKKKPKIVDRRARTDMEWPIKFTGQLRDHQKKPLAQMLKAGYGVLKAPPRAGKTVMATYLTCKFGKKTLILAAQQEWLDEFYRTFVGNEENPAMTNIPEIEQFESRTIIKNKCKTLADFENHDVCLATYQTFISPGGRKKLQKIKKMFGTVIVDEVHYGASTEFSRVLIELNARHKIGLTGTDDRKDGLYKVVKDIMGPVTALTTVQTLQPTLELINTGAETAQDYKQWTYAMRYLANHKERNRLIVKHAVHDIKAGRSIVIPVTLVAHARGLADAINKKMGKTVAAAFVSQGLNPKARRAILEGARSYKIKCIVGIRSLVQTGVNVPRWDTLYEVMPISNVPKFTQETSRIKTVEDGKKPPMIKHFLEVFGPTLGCFRTCFFQTYMKPGFKVSKETKAKALAYLKSRPRRGGGGGNNRFDLV